MDSKEIAKLMIEKMAARKSDAFKIKDAIEALIHNALADVKAITGAMPSEDDFLHLLAAMLDNAIVVPFPLEAIDDVVFYRILKIIDKALLDRVFGPTWYADAIAKIEALESKLEAPAAAVPVDAPLDAPAAPADDGINPEGGEIK